MLHVDIPGRDEIARLFAARHAASVSLYLPTTPLTQDAQADRVALKNLGRAALDQLRAADPPRGAVAALEEAIDDLVDDDEFWAHQARSLAVFATPDSTLTFRLPNTLTAIAEVSDRFHLKPLLRSVTWPQAAYVLALTQNAVRLIEVSGDLPAATVKVEGMPRDAASAVGKASILDRSPSGRVQGAEGQKLRLRQYARLVDQALRNRIHGEDVPLILAANPPLESIYASVNTYPHLAARTLGGNSDTTSDADLANAARGVLDEMRRAEIDSLHGLYRARAQAGRATSDIALAARAATFGAIDTLLVDIDEVVPGTVDDEGRVTLADGPSASTYGVVDEIASRSFLSGGRVLGVRRADIPDGRSLAAILRYAF